MTKKDYIILAKLIKDFTDDGNPEIILKDGFIDGLCKVLKSDNPRFDTTKFLEACK